MIELVLVPKGVQKQDGVIRGLYVFVRVLPSHFCTRVHHSVHMGASAAGRGGPTQEIFLLEFFQFYIFLLR